MDLLNLEQQRLALEQNLQKLRQSLKHWQLWEAEYEGLKEEIIGSGSDNTTSSQLESIANSYNGDLVNEKEIRELAGLDKGSPRTAKRITGLIERRQEYVQKNIETVQRQFFEEEAKSEELAFAVAKEGNVSSDSGLPLTEIHEELDEDGNVISSTLSQPEEATAKVVDSLRKAGVHEAELKKTPEPKLKTEDLKPAIINASPSISATSSNQEKKITFEPVVSSPTSDISQEDAERPSNRKKSVSFTSDTKAAAERLRPESEDGKKTVSFNDKIAVMPAAPPPDSRSVSFSPMVEEIPPLGTESPEMTATAVAQVTGSTGPANPGGVSEGVPADISARDDVVIPQDESPEDAKLRREMLEYHLNEVGNVVAQMDLEDASMNIDPDDYDDDGEEDDSSSFHTTSEYLDDEDTPYTTGQSEDEDSEDEYGRSKRSSISPEYRKQMEELSKKLIGNLGPASKGDDIAAADPDIDAKDVRKLVIREKRNSTSSASSESSDKKTVSKKRVSFAQSLDVAEPSSPPLKAQKMEEEGENIAPVASTITERSTAMPHSLPRRLSNDGASQFKKLRAAPITGTDSPAGAGSDLDMEDAAAIIDEPTPPIDAVMATTLKERKPARAGASAPSLTDHDHGAQRRELAAEYYRLRNDMIKQQGGFKNTDEDEELGELMEERDGKVKKLSRFKAARLKG